MTQARRASRREPLPRAKPDETRRPSRIRALRPARPSHDRRVALSRVLGLWPHELDDVSAAGRQLLLAKLRRALRAERRRGLAGHWTYDLARHCELLHLYRQEQAMLKAARAAADAAHPVAAGSKRER